MGNSGMLKVPSALVCVARSRPVAALRTVTLAPEITAPEGSVTVPKIVPRKVCAIKPVAANKKSPRTKRNFMTFLLCLASAAADGDAPLPGFGRDYMLFPQPGAAGQSG